MFHLIEMEFYGVNTLCSVCVVYILMMTMISNCHLILKIQMKFKNLIPKTFAMPTCVCQISYAQLKLSTSFATQYINDANNFCFSFRHFVFILAFSIFRFGTSILKCLYCKLMILKYLSERLANYATFYLFYLCDIF